MPNKMEWDAKGRHVLQLDTPEMTLEEARDAWAGLSGHGDGLKIITTTDEAHEAFIRCVKVLGSYCSVKS